jgi:hypothetical protein
VVFFPAVFFPAAGLAAGVPFVAVFLAAVWAPVGAGRATFAAARGVFAAFVGRAGIVFSSLFVDEILRSSMTDPGLLH